MTKTQTNRDFTATRVLRDRAIKSVVDIHAIAFQTDSGSRAFLEFRARQLNQFLKQFRNQEDAVRVFVELGRIDKLKSVDSLVTHKMETLYYEINFEIVPPSFLKSGASVSSTICNKLVP